ADVPGTKMRQKVPDADRAIIITYLKTYK
ncbi:MAG: hypothetical protein JWM33_3146, partial [Caulobacteraceae bacterium]|nr:hypothetical protein [Caulobacteraceae bacterium]